MAGPSSGPKTPLGSGGFTPREKDRKIGHRRVDDAGQVTYKKVNACFVAIKIIFKPLILDISGINVIL